MARKKVVFVIVEGPSDETALGVALSKMFDKESVHIHIMHGDITTRTGVTSQNIVAKVGDEVMLILMQSIFRRGTLLRINSVRNCLIRVMVFTPMM